MFFKALRTFSFRNLADSEVETSGGDVYLVGENGQGKTNFLEALYFCSYGSSFRGVRDKEMIRNGEEACSVSAALASPVYESVSVTVADGRKTVQLDGKKIDDRKEILSVAPSIIFCHEDMEFVAGTPERRRWFFDQSLSLYDLSYLEDLRRYKKILRTRNATLKEKAASGEVLDALDSQLAYYGVSLIEKRRSAAEKFSLSLSPLYREVSEIEDIAIHYAPSWKTSEEAKITAFLAERREMDLSFGTTMSGPHRDRYVFARKGREFAGNASTGQRRLLALLLRIAQAHLYTAMTGKKPVLLLDDVLLELDPAKRRRFLAVMPGYDQAFYTFLPEEPYERYRKADTLVYGVSGGVLRPL
jgi:DNA replication and repair protein RecF